MSNIMKDKKITSKGPGRPPKIKVVKKEIPLQEESPNLVDEYSVQVKEIPSVDIMKCISYQKFRYSGENRPGKKYQEKDFMVLRLNNLSEKVVRIVIICTDAENKELIHPNGLVGKDCHDGIYDKEYAITKPSMNLKIPYLRTERIKTKKNEHEKIKVVLHERALHLPSPYRERCLSQCTDKYTVTRKFDTTKVCLGVIVTVVNHQGVFNGNLHAISHVVRNASEKTSLGIYKLSQDQIPASTGTEIDVFTTEEGPMIEPGKCSVFVSCDLENNEQWVSRKFIPQKEDLLYKRVIRFPVPCLEPNPHVVGMVEARLHLECPQSNQFTSCPIYYSQVPPDVVVIDQRDYSLKRGFAEMEDTKPNIKKLRQDLEMGDGTRNIKANLSAKIKAKQGGDGDSEYASSNSQAEEPEPMLLSANPHYSVYNNQHVLVHHNSISGEPSVLVNMDSNKSSGGTLVLQDENARALTQMKNLKGDQYQAQGQDVVVAAGYSDAVPPNTTVYIYTTPGDNGPSEHIAINETTGEQLVLNSHLMAQGGHYVQNIISSPSSEGKKIEIYSDSVNEYQPLRDMNVVRATGISEKGSPTLLNHNKQSVCLERSDQGQLIGGKACSIQQLIGSPDMHRLSSSSSPASMFTSTTIASPGTPFRMLPSKKQQASPWEVEDNEDAALAASLMVQGGIYNVPRLKTSNTQVAVTSSSTTIVTDKEYNKGEYSNTKLMNIDGKKGDHPHIVMMSEVPHVEIQAPQLTSMTLGLGQILEENATESIGGDLTTMQLADFVENLGKEIGLPKAMETIVTKTSKPST